MSKIQRAHSVHVLCPVKCREVTVKKKRIETLRHHDGTIQIEKKPSCMTTWARSCSLNKCKKTGTTSMDMTKDTLLCEGMGEMERTQAHCYGTENSTKC